MHANTEMSCGTRDRARDRHGHKLRCLLPCLLPLHRRMPRHNLPGSTAGIIASKCMWACASPNIAAAFGVDDDGGGEERDEVSAVLPLEAKATGRMRAEGATSGLPRTCGSGNDFLQMTLGGGMQAWCAILEQPTLLEEVPLESAQAVLDVGYLHGSSFEGLGTSRCSILFRSLLGVPIVNSSFIFYRIAFLHAALLRCGVEVTRFNLTRAAVVFLNVFQGARLNMRFSIRRSPGP